MKLSPQEAIDFILADLKQEAKVEKFEKCEAAGLDVHSHVAVRKGTEAMNLINEPFILAADVEKLLSEGVEVRGFKNEYGWQLSDDDRDSRDTHFGLFINPKPIEKPDTAESLLKEIIAKTDRWGRYSEWSEWIERAKRLLNK